jgi:phosphoglucomutase
MAASAADENKSLYDWLIDMYVEHAYYKEGLVNLVRKGQQGEQEIKAMMEKFRNNPPKTIDGTAVVRMLDYKTMKEKEFKTGKTNPLNFPASDVIQFYMEDGSKVSVRPSGTEPKIKFYISVQTKLNSSAEFDSVSGALDTKIKAIEKDIIQ